MYTVAYWVLTVPMPWSPAGHQVWTAPLRNETERSHITFNGTKFCLIEFLWVFRSRYLLKISNVIKRKHGSFEKLHWTSTKTFPL